VLQFRVGEFFFGDVLSSNLITPSVNLVTKEKGREKRDENMEKKMTPDTGEDYKKSTD
jgi:hypothetical protein